MPPKSNLVLPITKYFEKQNFHKSFYRKCWPNSRKIVVFKFYRNGEEVQDQPWGLQEPSGEECVVADSALQWQWNSVRCVISAHVVCERSLQRCPSPDVNAGSYIKTSK